MKPTTCDYELSKKLYDMGIRIDTTFYYVEDDNRIVCNLGIKHGDRTYILLSNHTIMQIEPFVTPAPQLHELLDVMPDNLDIGHDNICNWKLSHLVVRDVLGEYGFEYHTQNKILLISREDDTNPANAVAKTLIWFVDRS